MNEHNYKSLIFLCCTISFCFYFGSYMRIPVVPLFAQSLGANTVEIGLINSSFLLTAGILSIPLGILSDRFGKKLLILCGLLLSSSSCFLLYFSTTPLQMVWIYLLFGMGLAAFAPTMMSLVADLSPATHLGRAYGWYTMALYGGMSIGPAVGGLMAVKLGFEPVFLFAGFFILLVCFLVFSFLPGARHVLISKPKQRVTVSSVIHLLQNRPLLACWLVTLGACFGLGMFVTFVPLHAGAQGMSVSSIGFIFGVQAVTNALSRIPFGWLSDRVAERSTLVVFGLLGFAVCIAGFGMASSFPAFVLCAAGMGVSMGVAFTAIGALISELVPPESRGLAMGGYNSAIYIGMMLSSGSMGVVIRMTGFQRGFLIASAINLIFTGIYYLALSSLRSNGAHHQ
jgi:MFS transporter, DHA1 family, multidrug resistance protein